MLILLLLLFLQLLLPSALGCCFRCCISPPFVSLKKLVVVIETRNSPFGPSIPLVVCLAILTQWPSSRDSPDDAVGHWLWFTPPFSPQVSLPTPYFPSWASSVVCLDLREPPLQVTQKFLRCSPVLPSSRFSSLCICYCFCFSSLFVVLLTDMDNRGLFVYLLIPFNPFCVYYLPSGCCLNRFYFYHFRLVSPLLRCTKKTTHQGKLKNFSLPSFAPNWLPFYYFSSHDGAFLEQLTTSRPFFVYLCAWSV